LIETISARNRHYLLENGERQAGRSRRIVARKIKENQLRKAAAKIESEKRRELRRKKKEANTQEIVPSSLTDP